MLATGIAESITIPIYSLRVDTIARTILWMLEIIPRRKLRSAVTSPLFSVQRGTRLEYSPKVLEGDDLVRDIIILRRDGVLKLCLKGPVQELQMFLGFLIFL